MTTTRPDTQPGTTPETSLFTAGTRTGSAEPPESALGDTPEILSPQNGAERLAAWRAAGGEQGPRLTPIERAALNPTSLRAAITAKCYDCVGQDADPRWQWRVGNCDAPCPLVPVRPHQHLAGTPTPASLVDRTEATS